MSNVQINEILELTDDELSQVSGGFGFPLHPIHPLPPSNPPRPVHPPVFG